MKTKKFTTSALLSFSFILFSSISSAQWFPQTSGTNLTFGSVCFTDYNNGWVVGESSIYHTSNGGDLWELQYVDSILPLLDIHFIDSLCGWAVGWTGWPPSPSEYIVLHTDDGGFTWTEQVSGSPGRCYSVCFTSKNNGWMAGIILWHTTDAGLTWTIHDLGSGLYDVFFIDHDHGWAVGETGATLYGSIFHTSDGGITWEEQTSGTAYELLDVFFVDQYTGWAVGPAYTIIHTSNGGDTWQMQHNANYNDGIFVSIFFSNALNGWAVGSNGRIMHTSDGGAIWEIQSSGTGVDLRGVCATDENSGWIVGNGGTILHTDNGGLTDVEEYEGQNFSHHLQCYPNPFSDNLTITFKLLESSFTQIQTYNSKGKKIKEINSRMFPEGEHEIDWKAGDLPPGIYFIQLHIDSEYISKKIIKIN